MSYVAIETERLGKQYRLGQLERYGALRDSMAAALAVPGRALASAVRGDRPERVRRESFWALRDVDIQIEQGESVGIIGRNGAGKSTLLKVLSRITEPTDGRATLRGRVGSLLEVGTGFHNELTGRENIYLNGAILGMRRAEIRRKFDEIVEFAGTSRFLDTPVKRHSTGMQVRLAFSVAAHLDTEILLVDEVLSVGDVEFQRKCLGKMENATYEGRTVLFVSHNLTAIRRFCPRTILLKGGRIEADGDTDSVLNTYLEEALGSRSAVVEGDELDRRARTSVSREHAEPVFHAKRIALEDEQGVPRTSFNSDEPFDVVLDYEMKDTVTGMEIIFAIVNVDGDVILRSEAADCADSGLPYRAEPGLYRSRCRIPANLFGENRFYVNAYMLCRQMQFTDMEGILDFDVAFQGYNGNYSEHTRQAYFRPSLQWEVERRVGAASR